MILNVIFSFNRAMQLDFLLKSSLKHFKFDYKILVIYHTTGDHYLGYKKLIEEYSSNQKIIFQEKKENKITFFEKILSRTKLKKIKSENNFKNLLENLLFREKLEFVMFNTDDGYWFSDIELESSILNIIRLNPLSVSYRLYVGDNLEGFPNYVKKWGQYYLWDYYFDENLTHWSYPFAVDATIYHRESILSIIKNVDYYNPVTLEDLTVNYIKKQKKFAIGLSPLQSKLVGTKLNRVAVETKNPTIHISVDELNRFFIQNYKLDLELPIPLNNANVVPLKVNLLKGEFKINIYSIDEFGNDVQNNLGIEGAKKQMD